MQDVISYDGYLAAFPNHYYKTDVFYRGQFMWRNRRVDPPPKSTDLIVSGQSDYPITDKISSKYVFRSWWSPNSESISVKGLPIGITNIYPDGEFNYIFGNTEIMKQAADIPREIKNRVYLNFSKHTHPIRHDVYAMFKDKQWVSVGQQVNTMNGRFNYLKEMRNHEFVLCPRGNGVDTHRLWETLYMGSIPIVQNDIVHRGWLDLPIAWVDSFSEVTPEWLDSQLKRIQDGVWNMDKIKLSYWVKKISEDSGVNAVSV